MREGRDTRSLVVAAVTAPDRAQLTPELLNKAMKQIAARGSEPRYDCRFDGHVEHFCSTRCVYCHQVIRELEPDERRFLLGEFDA